MHWRGNDLRRYDVVQLPAETVVASVLLDYRPRRAIWSVVALQAHGVLNLERDGNVQSPARGCIAFIQQFRLFRVLPESTHNIRFPIGGAIARIRRIQRGFFVGVLGILLAQLFEVLVRRIGGH